MTRADGYDREACCRDHEYDAVRLTGRDSGGKDAAKSTRNSGKQWSAADEKQLKQLAKEGEFRGHHT